MDEKIMAADAHGLLNNPAFKTSIAKMEGYLESQALSTDPDNKEKCARIVISKQLLKGIIRELERLVEAGEIHDLIELEKRKKSIKERVFQR